MAQMRSAVRVLVAVNPDPASVLPRLDKFFDHYDLDQLVTMLYAVADPASDQVVIANAGHLPPVIIRADGSAETVPMREGCCSARAAHRAPSAPSRWHPGTRSSPSPTVSSNGATRG